MTPGSAASGEGLTFSPTIQTPPRIEIAKAAVSVPAPKLKPAAPTGDRQAMLSKACGGDAKCVCINHAIFKHDSSWATAGVGKRALNPCNMRVPATWKPSVPMRSIKSVNGVFARFDSLQDGVTACVELWQRLYKDLPADKLVSRWTDGGGNTAYRSAVRSCYVDA